MSSFDAAIALSQDQLNQVLAIIYQKVFPKVFSGSQTVNQQGIEYVEWVISDAPQFNLSAGSDGSTFEIVFTGVGTRLDPVNNGEPIVYQLTNVKATCSIKVSGNTVSFVPQTATCDPLSDPTQQFFANLVFLPAVQSALDNLLSGFMIPAIAFQGVSMSGPSAVMVDNYFVMAVNLAAKGTPGPAPAGSWTSSGFSLLISADLMQAGVTGQALSFSHNGSATAGSQLGGYSWNYSLNLNNPVVASAGANFTMTFSVSCSVNATAYVQYNSVPVGFTAGISPNPSAVCSLVVSSSGTQLVAQSVSPFTVNASPSGGVPPEVADWMTTGIAITIANSITPLVQQYLGSIQSGSVSIPVFTEQIAGLTITLTPTGLVQSTVDGYTALGGTISAD